LPALWRLTLRTEKEVERRNKIRHSKLPLDSEYQGERMVNEPGVSGQAIPEIELMAVRSARDRARVAKWGLDAAVFLYAILIVIMILLFQGIALEIVAPVALFGLAVVWLTGWRRGKQLYQHFYYEELLKLERRSKDKVEGRTEERIDELVRRSLREGRV